MAKGRDDVFKILKSNPKDYLNLLIVLESEKCAIKFYNHLNELSILENVTALEYFGYNTQSFMINKEYFFKILAIH